MGSAREIFIRKVEVGQEMETARVIIKTGSYGKRFDRTDVQLRYQDRL